MDCNKTYTTQRGAEHHRDAGCRDKRLRVHNPPPEGHAGALPQDAREDLPGAVPHEAAEDLPAAAVHPEAAAEEQPDAAQGPPGEGGEPSDDADESPSEADEPPDQAGAGDQDEDMAQPDLDGINALLDDMHLEDIAAADGDDGGGCDYDDYFDEWEEIAAQEAEEMEQDEAVLAEDEGRSRAKALSSIT
ncbi:hypothetical protein COCOBI_19-1850 [Coccomyxa sp. Obi]|nr:hypothetical protein COCOBI_19-1850 [Coccomyxa sp. Obi]